MQIQKILSLSAMTASLVLLAGAGCTQPVVTNTNVVVDTNENTDVTVANENTNAEQGSEIDTSDWLTYKNEEYGFSFRYPTTLYINDKTLIQSEGSYKLLLTLGETQNPNDEDLGVDVWKVDLIDRHDGVIEAVNKDPNQEVISDVNNSSMSKTITTRNKTSGQTKVMTLTESNGNVISFTCAEWFDKELCSQIISTLQLM